MLTKDDISLIDDSFYILFYNAFCVTIRSKATDHEWHIIVREYNHSKSFEIWHRHSAKDAFHLHGHGKSIQKVIEKIKCHDEFQLNVRKHK